METFIKVYIKSEEDLPEKEGNYISCTNDTNYIRDRHYRFSLRWNWLNGIIWYLKPVEIPEISDEEIENYFINQKIEADFTRAEKGLIKRSRMFGAKWYKEKLKKRMTK